MNYTLSTLAEILRSPMPLSPEREVSILLTDSRSLTYPSQSLFFAIRTPNNDGHRYLKELYDKGVRAFVVDNIPAEAEATMPEASFIVVEDVAGALQTISSHHRRRFGIPVIGITGSCGKTTVKEWLYQLLNSDYNIVRSPRSYNSQIGVPLSLWEINPDTQLAIIEAGISLPGEMTRLESMIKPNIALITNIGDEHADGFSSKEQKCHEKATLLREAQCVIYCADDPTISEAVKCEAPGATELAWSTRDSDRQLFISEIRRSEDSTLIRYSYLKVDGEMTIPFTDDADIQNAIHSLAVMLYLRCPAEVIRERMSGLTPVGTRLEVLEGINNCLLIYDSYTSDLHSLTPAIDFMERRITPSRTQTLILSDVMHEDIEPSRLYRTIARLIESKNITRVIGIGTGISAYSQYFGPDSQFYPSTEEFLRSVSPSDFDNELILIKGAPGFHFERIAEMLEAKQHETVLEVNLSSVVHNYNFYRSRLRPSTGIVCMVKASGYGAGSYELAKTLQSQGAAYLAVAVMDEGVELRKAGITMPIMVLNPRVVNYKTLFTYRLEPEIFSFDMLNEIIAEARKYSITDYPVHIKLDTGMHRLGFIESEIPEVAKILSQQNAVFPCSAFSHLAAADCPDMDDYTYEQFAIFDRCCDELQRSFSRHILRHILNSTGITRFPDHQCDMVRLGICLYGIPTMDDGSQSDLRPVSALYTVVLAVREWPEGTTIGYCRRGLLKRRSRIATIPVGYADGIDRHLGNGGMSVWINGHLCPTVGNICMDVCMVDVTDTECQPGDSVEIFGPHIPVSSLAATLDTIPYEVLTSVSSRVKRLYFRE